MPWICTKRERTQYIWSALMILTAVACIILLYLSLEFTGNYCRRAGKCSEKFMKEPAQLAEEKCISSCSTEQCVRLANALQNTMDRIVDPCENFYSLSCGKFSEKFGKDDNATIFDSSTKEFAADLKDLLDHLDPNPETPSGKMKITYDSCMDIGSSELQAVPTALEFLTKIGIPNWPHLDPDFKFTFPSLSTVLGISHVYHEFSFISFTNYDVDGKPVFNATVECSDSLFTSPKPGTPMEYFIDRILKYFGIEGEKNREAKERLFVFHKFLDCIPDDDICEKHNATEIFLDCSQENESEWKMLCEMIDTFVDIANMSNKMSKDHVVIPCSISIYAKKFLKEIHNISDRAIADFLAINFFFEHLDDLSFYFRLMKQKDPNAHDVIEEIDFPINRWEHCVEWIVRNMDVALAHEYILRYLSKESLLEVQDIVKECFEEARDLIHHQKWLTEEEKLNITNELNVTTSVDFQIKKYLNETFVNGFYRQFHPTRESFLKNVLELQTIYFVAHQVEMWEQPYFNDMKPFAVNAYARSNLIEIGMGFLRFPFYFSEGTRSLNTVILDATIAHEIGHVLTGVLDAYEVNETSTREFYDHRRLCLQNQFSNFTIESLGVNVNAELTEDEFLADNFATILVDMLMKRYFTDEGAFTLPSLPYSTKQLLYIIISQYFCAKNSKEMEKLYHESDPHPPPKYRMIAAMQNSKDFSEVFSCSEESYMNPSSKCLLVDEKTE